MNSATEAGNPAVPSPNDQGGAGFLGVECSLSGKCWRLRSADERAVLALAQRLGVPEIVGRVMAGRGIEVEKAETFLNPTLREMLPDPSDLKDMDVGAERLAKAVMVGERIAVFGDYDVDGATSGALLSRFFSSLGREVRAYVPDRLKEGYGPNAEAMLRLKHEGVSVVVTVDCGISAHDALAAAAAAGVDVVVVDHHAADAHLPPAVAVINPKRLDESGENSHLAAVGVAFLLAVAINRTLRKAGWYDSRAEPDLRQWLDLVAVGTVCDLVPLTGVNRAFVTQGLKVMAGRSNAGLRALADLAGVGQRPESYHLGFMIGPRINAGGRVGEAGLGTRLLSTDDDAEASAIAERLGELNRERQRIEADVLAEALARIADLDGDLGAAPVLLAAGENWHPGVVGIVASRLVERFNRPTCVVALDGDIGTGSGRSVAGFDLGAAVNAAREAGLLIKGGGHAMAAGFTVERIRLNAVREFFVEHQRSAIANLDQRAGLLLDGALSVSGATLSLSAVLAQAGPFGMGNPEPRFVISGVRLAYVGAAGSNHLRCVLADDQNARLDAIAFRSLDTPMGQALRNHAGAPFHLAGRLKENTWRGRTTVQFLIDDAAPAFA